MEDARNAVGEVYTNARVRDFLSLYSQSKPSNKGTRGLDDDFSRSTYVRTQLDEVLAPKVFLATTRLVILTGNAGDGKTAFIKTIENEARRRGASFQIETDNGCRFTLNGRQFETLYDGSQDFDGQSNDEVLEQFFQPFEGQSAPVSAVTKIIAINEGRLRDFVLNKNQYTWLGRQVYFFFENSQDTDESLIIINLNLRSVVNGALSSTESIFDSLLDRFLLPTFWEKCSGCPVKDRCPIKYNVDSLSHPAQGPIVRERLKRVFQVTHLRKRLHITMRDLRSALAYVLVNKDDCPEIQAKLLRGEALVGHFYYNAIFDPKEADRLIRLLGEVDVALVTNPKLDNFINYHDVESPEFRSLALAFIGRSKADVLGLQRLAVDRPEGTLDDDKRRRENALTYHRSLRRKLFFEMDYEKSKDRSLPSDPDEMLPFSRLNEFLTFIESGSDPQNRLRDDLTLAISRSERIYNNQVGRENLCVRTADNRESEVKSFYSFPAHDFTVMVRKNATHTALVEFLPNAISFAYRDGKPNHPELEINLDLFEILMKIRDGYVPTATEVKTFFLNLLMFKRQLMTHPADRVILTDDDVNLFQIKKTATGNLVMSSMGGS